MPDNGSCLFRIRGSAQGLKGQDSSSLFTKTRYQMKNRVNETQARLQPSAATSMVWMLLRSASAMLKEHVIVRTIINPNKPLRLSRLVLAGAFGSWSESLGEGSNLPYLHDLTSRYWDSLPSWLRIGALNRGLQRPAPQLPCPQKGKQ